MYHETICLSLRREISSTAAHCFLRYFFSIGTPMQMPRLLSRSPAIGGTRYPRESLIYWLQNRRAWPWGESRTRAVRLTRPFGPEEAKSTTLILSMYLSITERAETCNSQKVARALRHAFREDRDYLKPVKTFQNKNVWSEYPYYIWIAFGTWFGTPRNTSIIDNERIARINRPFDFFL